MIFRNICNKLNFICRTTNYSTYNGLTGGQIIHDICIKKNVKDVWIYSGGAVMGLVDTFYKSPINYIVNRHEQNSGHSACGYAKSSGKVGVVITTSGPGCTNMISPLQDALTDGVPLILFTGQVPTNAIGTDAFQECPAIKLTKPCTKWNYQISNIYDIPFYVNMAFDVAMKGRKGPVHIDLPKDVLSDIFYKEDYKKYVKRKDIYNNLGGLMKIIGKENNWVSQYYNIDKVFKDNMNNIIDLLNIVKKPIIITGNGVVDDYKLLRKFAKNTNIPVTTTLHGVGSFDSLHPNSLPFLGMHGSVCSNYAIQNSDLILSFGSRFDDRTTGTAKTYAPEARKAEKENRGGIIHIDIEEKQIGKNIIPTIKVVSDCKKVLEYLNNKIDDKKIIKREYKEWYNQINEWKEKHPFTYDKCSDGRIKTQQVIEEINKQLVGYKDYIITTGVGNHQQWTAQYIDWRVPRSLITSGSLGIMGAGIGFAIGAKVANPDKNVILIDGDSSFNMTLQELGTILQYNIPIKICIMNDSRAQMVNIWERLFYNERHVATINSNPDYVKLGESFSIHSIYCDNENDLENTVKEMLTTNKPILCEFKVEPDICLPLVAPGCALNEMILKDPKDDENPDVVMSGLAPS